MADIGELVVRIRADASQLERELRRTNGVVEQSAKQMESSVKKATAEAAKSGQALGRTLAGIATALFSKQLIDSIDRLNDLSNQLGVSTEALSTFEYAAKLSGTTLESAAQGMKLLGKNVSDAAAGIGEAKNTFKDLHLDAKALASLPLDQQFERVAEALNGISNQGDKIAYVRSLFGRMGVELLPLINDFQELKDEAIAVGYVLSEETAQRFAMFNDEIDRFSLASQVLARNLMEILLPALTDTLAGVNELFAGMKNTSKFFNELGVGIIGVGAKIGLIDQDIADAAADEAAGNIATGQARRSPSLKIRIPSSERSGRSGRAAKTGVEKQADDYDKAGDALSNLLQKYQQEAELAGLSGKALEMRRAELEATSAAIKNDSLGTSQALIEQIRQQAGRTYDLKEAQDKLNESTREAARFQQELHDKLSSSLTDIVFKTGSATEAMLGFAESIAKAAFEKKVAGPLADALIGTSGSKGLLDDAIGNVGSLFGGFFADGGMPPVGRPSIVGERGPEIFVPKTAGTIIPNGGMGGTSVNVYQTFNMSPGLAETVNAAVLQAAPIIAAQTHASVFQAIRQGGNESLITGLRS